MGFIPADNTILSTLRGTVIMTALALLSRLAGLEWMFPLGISLGIAIISGGFTGIIIGSNEMRPAAGAVSGTVILGIIFVVASSFRPQPGLLFAFSLLQALISGGITGTLCAVILQKSRRRYFNEKRNTGFNKTA
ncbi:MAG: hypothetical protein JXJ19_06220 [Elusimicrobia bacterium]|nr:hypothetical protein [Elusimicrobiota bacterium]